jgi:hypothetical protein
VTDEEDGGLVVSGELPAAARALLARRRAAVRAVSEDLLRLADAGPSSCAHCPVDVWAVRRYHLAEYLAQPRPDGRAFAPKTLERRLAAICGLYTYALDLALIQQHPRAHGKRLRVDAKRAQGAAALSKAEFERFVSAAREHSPNALAIVLLLRLYGLRVSRGLRPADRATGLESRPTGAVRCRQGPRRQRDLDVPRPPRRAPSAPARRRRTRLRAAAAQAQRPPLCALGDRRATAHALSPRTGPDAPDTARAARDIHHARAE